MNQKKNKGLKIAIIILTIIIILLITVIGYLYFLTDMFKTNKQLFLKYTSQLVQKENGFIDKKIIKYLENKKTMPYENNGNISFDISSTDTEIQNLIKNFNIEYSGKNKNGENKNEYNINLKYSQDVQVPFIYKKINDIQGIQTEYIGSKFVAKKDGEKIPNLNIDLDYINPKEYNLDFQNLNNMLVNMDENRFSKITQGNSEGYKITLSGEETKNILTQFFEKIDSTYISKITYNLNNSEIEETELILYKQNNHLNEVIIKQENFEITLKETTNNNNEVGYSLNLIIVDTLNLEFKVDYSGFTTDTINENYNLSIEYTDNTEKSNYKYNINNNIKFVNNINIEEFKDDNAIILNEKEEEYVQTLITAIKERLINVNKSQMEKLNVTEEKNPLFHLMPTEIFEKFNIIQDSKVSELQVAEFNEKFNLYKGTSQKGVTVRGLMTTIGLNNGFNVSNNINEELANNNNPKIIEIHFNGDEYEVTEETVRIIKEKIEPESLYRVEFEMDSTNGLIYRVVINKQ